LIPRRRLLDPGKIVTLERARDSDRHRHIQTAMDIDHEIDVWPYRIADRLDAGDRRRSFPAIHFKPGGSERVPFQCTKSG
jgi:hypothetical protein